MIPVNEPSLGERELEYAAECVRSGWISSAGRFIEEFEARWASYCGRRHGVAVANGTVALQIAIDSLDLKAGDEVIMPTFTIISCATSVVYAGCVPVLVDADPMTWCMDVARIEECVTDRTRAIMAVPIYGHPVDMDPLMEVAERHGLMVVEDAAEAHGAEYLKGVATERPEWRRCGSFGAMSCFSFYANKLITTGEGGMVVTDDDATAARLRSLRNLCFEPGRRFFHRSLGYNFRLTNIQAALGLAQLERMDQIVSRKREIGKRYSERLSELPTLQLQVEQPWARGVYWMNGIVLSEATAMDAAEFARRLADRGIETRPFFLGMHEQPALHDLGLFLGQSFPVAERIARQGLYLPSGLTLTDPQIDAVCDAVEEELP